MHFMAALGMLFSMDGRLQVQSLRGLDSPTQCSTLRNQAILMGITISGCFMLFLLERWDPICRAAGVRQICEPRTLASHHRFYRMGLRLRQIPTRASFKAAAPRDSTSEICQIRLIHLTGAVVPQCHSPRDVIIFADQGT